MGLFDWLRQQQAQQYSAGPVPEQTPSRGPSAAPWAGMSEYLPTIEPGYQGGSPLPFSFGMPPAFRGQPPPPQVPPRSATSPPPAPGYVPPPAPQPLGGGAPPVPSISRPRPQPMMSGMMGAGGPDDIMTQLKTPGQAMSIPDTSLAKPNQPLGSQVPWGEIGRGGLALLATALGGPAAAQGYAGQIERQRQEELERSARETEWKRRTEEMQGRQGFEQRQAEAESQRRNEEQRRREAFEAEQGGLQRTSQEKIHLGDRALDERRLRMQEGNIAADNARAQAQLEFMKGNVKDQKSQLALQALRSMGAGTESEILWSPEQKQQADSLRQLVFGQLGMGNQMSGPPVPPGAPGPIGSKHKGPDGKMYQVTPDGMIQVP